MEPLIANMAYMTSIGNHERDWPSSGDRFPTMRDSGGECGVPHERRFLMPSLSQDAPWCVNLSNLFGMSRTLLIQYIVLLSVRFSSYRWYSLVFRGREHRKHTSYGNYSVERCMYTSKNAPQQRRSYALSSKNLARFMCLVCSLSEEPVKLRCSFSYPVFGLNKNMHI